MLNLPQNPTVQDFQKYVDELETERGFKGQDATQKCLLLGEEIGELFKAIRKHQTNLKVDPNSKVGSVEEELADVLIYTCAIANKLNIDLEKAFREKEEVNKKRHGNRSLGCSAYTISGWLRKVEPCGGCKKRVSDLVDF